MPFRLLHYIVSLSYEHLQQGNKKLPIILPLCIYHGQVSPYPHSIDLYDNFEDPEFARKVALKPFKLVDLTILTDEEIRKHGLASLMEMLFKHHRAKNFLSIMRDMLNSHIVQNVVKQLNISYLNDMLNYVLSTTQDETEPKAAQHLIKELIQAFPKEKEVIMTFAQQLKQEGIQQGVQQGLKEANLLIAKKMLARGYKLDAIKDLLELSDQALLNLKD